MEEIREQIAEMIWADETRPVPNSARELAKQILSLIQPKVEKAKRAMLGKIFTQSVVRYRVDIKDKKRKPFRSVSMPVEWWDNLLT